ncbi:MAG: zinc ribbon domain-containing protein [Verrucomicrobiota bacterium]
MSILEQLLIVQEKDVALAKVNQDLERLPREEKQLEEKIALNSKQLDELKTNTKKIEAQRKELELQVESKKQRIAKYRTQQYETKKNEEYQALGTEITREEEDIVKLEDQQLELMEKYDAAQREVATEAARVQQQNKNAESLKTELKKKSENLAERQKTLQAELAELEKQTEAAALGRYRRILASKKDMAIATIMNGNTCGGCFMQITPQTVLKAKANKELVVCDYCGRLLFFPKE